MNSRANPAIRSLHVNENSTLEFNSMEEVTSSAAKFGFEIGDTVMVKGLLGIDYITLKSTNEGGFGVEQPGIGWWVRGEIQGYALNKFGRIENTIEELVNNGRKYKVGDVVELLGYYNAGDGAGHKRKIEQADDGSGVQLANGLWANIVHDGEVNVSWFGARGDGVADDTVAIQKALDFVIVSRTSVILDGGKVYLTSDVLYLWSNQKNFRAWGDQGTTLKANTGYATLRKTTNSKTTGCYEDYLNDIDAVIAFTSNDRVRNWGVCLNLENIIFENINSTPNSWAIARIGGGLDIIKNLQYKNIAGFLCPDRWFHNNMSMIRGNDRILVIGLTGTSNSIDTIVSHGNRTTFPTLSLRGDKSTLSNCCLETQEGGTSIEFAFASWELSGIDIEPSSKVEIPKITAKNSSIKINQIQVPHPTINDVSFFSGVGSRIDINDMLIVVSSNSIIENTYLMKSGDLNIKVNTVFFSPNNDKASEETLTALKNNFKLSGVYSVKNFISVGNIITNSTSTPYSNVIIDTDNRAYIGNGLCGFGRMFRGLETPQIAYDGTSVKWARGYKKDDIIFIKDTAEKGILGYVASNDASDVNGNTYNTIPLVVKSTSPPTSPKVGSFWIKSLDNSLNFFDGVIWQKITSLSTFSIEELNTPYHTLKMQQEGVYEDFIQYMDAKTEYDAQQREAQAQQQAAFEQREDQNQTYEEWLSSYPMLLPAGEEPQPSEALVAFKTKYLG